MKENIEKAGGWTFNSLQNGFWRARKGKNNVCAYKSGRIVIGGKRFKETLKFIPDLI